LTAMVQRPKLPPLVVDPWSRFCWWLAVQLLEFLLPKRYAEKNAAVYYHSAALQLLVNSPLPLAYL
jgi:hypothetical protein